jgi:PHP family Zn ribbon phosphoesterase
MKFKGLKKEIALTHCKKISQQGLKPAAGKYSSVSG